jgi:hypothetical protein
MICSTLCIFFIAVLRVHRRTNFSACPVFGAQTTRLFAHALVLVALFGRKEARNIAGSGMHPCAAVLAKWRVEWTSVNTGSKSGAVSGAGPFGV